MRYHGLFVGLTTIDIQYFVDEFPKSNVKIKTKTPEVLVGGPATNAAVAFSSLNQGAYLATASGNNAFTEFILNDFRSTGISYYDLAKNQRLNPVIASVITSVKNGDRNIFTHNPHLSSFDFKANELFQITNPDLIMIDGFYPDFSLECIKVAQENKIPVVADCGSWKTQYEELLSYVDIAICSNDFLPPKCRSKEDVFNYLTTKGIGQSAISRGADSIIYEHNNERGEIQIAKVEVVDTLGAGDFLHGAFCYHLLNTGSFVRSLKLGSETASKSCKYKGTRNWINK